MKNLWLHRENRAELIIFCNGWGMDGQPFRPLTAKKYDVCMLNDYSALGSAFDIEIERLFTQYEQVILVAWSMGVWAGQKIFSDMKEMFSRTIAINGTLCPINDAFGIPEKMFDETLNGFGEAARAKFYRRMCREKTNLKSFLANKPQRTLESQFAELAALRKNVDCSAVEDSIYQEIIIAENDWIIPSENQFRFWQDKRFLTIPGFHFLFYLWQSWDQLLAVSELSSPK